MSDKKLLPCPFCGGDNVDFWETDNKTHKYQIVCFGCFNGTDECKTEEEATRRWNTRQPMQNIVERLVNNFRKVKKDEDLEWNRAIYKTIEIVKEEGGLND